MKKIQCFLVFLLALLLSSCDGQSQGFNLPEGDAEQGKANFILLKCNSCHSVEGVQWDGIEGENAIHVRLGGMTAHVKSYGDLVTSIINPSHKLSRGSDPTTVTESGESRMRNYNEVMSVQELIDLVEFLQSKYEIWIPDYYTY